MIASNDKAKETRTSLYFSILGDIFIGADNCGLPIIVEGALVKLLIMIDNYNKNVRNLNAFILFSDVHL